MNLRSYETQLFNLLTGPLGLSNIVVSQEMKKEAETRDQRIKAGDCL